MPVYGHRTGRRVQRRHPLLLVHERVAAIAQSNPLQADFEKKKVSSATVDNEARMADAVVQTLKKFFGD